MRIKLMTYNIHKGIGGVDRKYRLDRITDTIAHYKPDVLLLQEVDDGVPRSRKHRQIDLLADQLQFDHKAFQANVRLRQGVYGNAVLSHFPMLETHNVDLTVRPKKRRQALIVKLRIYPHRDKKHDSRRASRTVIVTNVHLGLAAFERRIQLRRLLTDDRLKYAHHDTPAIIAGDFNDFWQNLGKGLLGTHKFVSALGRVRTFPAAFPMRCLDGIYYRGDLAPVNAFVGHTALAREASDHLPAIGEFRLSHL